MTSTPQDPQNDYTTGQPGAYGTPSYPPPDQQPIADAPAYSPYQPVGGGTPTPGYPGAGPLLYAGSADPRGGNRSLGWTGVVVLYVLLAVLLVWPTVITVLDSVRDSGPFGGGGEFVGFDRWSDVMPLLGSTIGFVLLAVLPVTIASLALGMAIGTALPATSRTSTLVRVLVAIIGALFVPLGVGVSRWMSAPDVSQPGSATMFLVVTVTLAWLPLLTAIFATAFGVAFAPSRGGRGAALIILVALVAVIPMALQVFDLPRVLTGGGPGGATETPGTLIYRLGFMVADFTAAAAVSTVVLLVAGLFGIVAMVVVLRSRSRLVVMPDGAASPPRSGLLGAVVAAVVLVVALFVVWPVLGNAVSGGGHDLVPSPVQAVLNAWGPAALGSAVQVAVAALGGAAIGWCRPAGDRSLWLLLPFAPWLFVGQTPLMLARFQIAQDLGIVDTWLALVPPPTLMIAALVVFALLFAGLREQGLRPPRGLVLAASAGAFGLLLLVHAQSLLPAGLMVADPEHYTALQFVFLAIGSFSQAGGVPYGLLYPLPLLLVVVALGVFGQLGTRRVALVRD